MKKQNIYTLVRYAVAADAMNGDASLLLLTRAFAEIC